RHELASRIFLEVRRLAADRRAAALADACRGDGALRAEVESLLQHDPGDDPPSAPRGTFTDEPQRIGPYRVLGRIGHGGSGYVLLAEQDEPIRRRVAIKIVPHAAISPDAAARFDFERPRLGAPDR